MLNRLRRLGYDCMDAGGRARMEQLPSVSVTRRYLELRKNVNHTITIKRAGLYRAAFIKKAQQTSRFERL